MATNKPATPIVTDPVIDQEKVLTPEEIAAEDAANALFNAANAEAPARIAKEEAVLTMSNEELNAEFGVTIPEAIGMLRDALSRSKSVFIDKMNGFLDKLEETSQL